MPKITTTGVTPITQTQYLETLKELYLSIDPKWILDSNAPDGQFVILISRLLWELDQRAIMVRASTDPRQASNSQVDDLAALFDQYRDQSQQSSITFDLVGTDDTLVDAGSQIKNQQTGEIWTLKEAVTIPNSGVFESVDYGVISAAGDFVPNTLITGWDGVENPTGFSVGREEESDEELEEKRKNSVALAAQGIRAAIKAKILTLDGVTACEVIENELDEAVDGQPPHSIHCVVNGGDEMEICEAIDSKISTGCRTHGTIENLVTTEDDPNGMTRRFDRPDFVDVWVKYTITGTSNIKSSDLNLIPSYVEQYATGAVDLPFNSNDGGFKLGQSPSSDLLAEPMMWAIGSYIASDSSVYSESIQFSTDGENWVNKVLPISRLQQALFSADRVEIVSA